MNRKLLAITSLVVLFVVVTLVWYFFYAKPVITPSLSETNNPLPKRLLPKGFQFIGINSGDDDQTGTTEVTETKGSPLVKVWDKPATGQFFLNETILREETSTSTVGTTTTLVKKTIRATSTVLLFVDRTTGYIYGHSFESGKTFQVSNSLYPGVHDAYIFNGGKRIIFRYFDEDPNMVVGVIATLPLVREDSSPSALTNIEYLNAKVTSVAVSESQNEASYLVSTDSGSAVYSVVDKDPFLITTSPFSEWILSYGGERIYVTSKPSAYTIGITSSIPTFNLLVGERTGLMSSPYTNNSSLSSMWSNTGLLTFISKNNELLPLEIKTLAPKCSWKDSTFILCGVPNTLNKSEHGLPDDWLQGRTSFKDSLVTINPSTLETTSFFTFKEDLGAFDVTNITFSKDSDFISFVNKRNGDLWLLKPSLIDRGE